jgi:alpha-tubulin suppressor-like RCC1 family protein
MTRACLSVAVIAALGCQGTPAPARIAVDEGGVGSAVIDAPPRVTRAEPAPPTPEALAPSRADVIQMAAGQRHACALHADGTVSCWGENDRGQLGDGAIVPRAKPAGVPGIDDAVEVAAGQGRTCIRRRAGGVACWGSPGGVPESIAGVDDAVEITTRCARRHDRTVACWHDMQRADPVPLVDDAVDIASHGERTCVARLSGVVTCWVTASAYNIQSGDRRVRDVVEVALGDDHTCGRRLDGKVTCWAKRYDTQYGPPTVTSPRALPKTTGVVQLVSAQRYGCVRSPGKPVSCWGFTPDEPYGGDAHALARPEPHAIVGLGAGDVDEIVAGDTFACARRGGRDIRCWGENRRGQLGIGTWSIQTAPAIVPGVAGAIDVHAGDRYTCARLTNGDVTCWGAGRPRPPSSGNAPTITPQMQGAVQIAGRDRPCLRTADGTVTCQATTRAVGATDLTATSRHGCAVVGGTVRCWGASSFDIGFRMPEQRDGRGTVEMPGATGVVQVAIGGRTTCVLRGDGAIACTGRVQGGARFQVEQQLRPVGGIANATAFALGDGFGCATIGDRDRTVRCWGDNDGGQLGDGTTTPRRHAVAVTGLTEVEQIVAGDRTACARRLDGVVWCWGSNHTGVLGDVAIPSRAEPTAIAGATDAVDVALSRHACIARRGGDVMCWGLADAEQVGTATRPQSVVPVAVVWGD